MFYILIVGIAMAILSAIFWCIESLAFVRKVRTLKKPDTSRNSLVVAIQSVIYIAGFLAATVKLWPLVVDVLVTVWLAGSFGFSGMIGGVIGVSISNVISVFLLIISREQKNELQ